MSSSRRFHILFDFAAHRHGGGSSFLSLLREELRRRDQYVEEMSGADVIFFNSHQSAASVMAARRKNPKAIFIQRVDGPMSIYNRPDDPRDAIVRQLGANVADGLIFQSAWSHREGSRLGLVADLPFAVIPNAPNPKLFRVSPRTLASNEKVRLVGTNWSTHVNKGFPTYDWLDKNLDFNRYEITLVGHVPHNYKNIKVLGPMDKAGLLFELNRAHIFVMPSRFEACSNALVEALHLGLPVMAYAGSSNVELVTDSDQLYTNESEIPEKLEAICKSYDAKAGRCDLPALGEIVDRYISFSSQIQRCGQISFWSLLGQELMLRARRV